MMLSNPRIINFTPTAQRITAQCEQRRGDTTRRFSRPVVGYLTMLIDKTSTGVTHCGAPGFTTTLFAEGAGDDTTAVLPATIDINGTVVPITDATTFIHHDQIGDK